MVRAAALASLLLATTASADVMSAHSDSVSVTLYHTRAADMDDLTRGYTSDKEAFGFITETRELDLPAGPSVIRFSDVASTIVPESASIKGLPQNPAEQDFDYDLLSPGALLAHSIGETVHLVRTDEKNGKETDQPVLIRAAASGAVLDNGGKIEALHCGGPAERLVFDRIPSGLMATPTLSARVTVPQAGHYTVKLSYIATGMNWAANYVARINPDGKTLALSGWITLANFSDTSFHDAQTEVVAGHLNTTGDDRPNRAQAESVTPKCWPLSVDWGTPVMSDVLRRRLEGRYPQVGLYSSSPVTAVSSEIDPRALGDYKLYPLPVATTVAARQTKQVQFLDLHEVKFERIYAYASMLNKDDTSNVLGLAIAEYRLQNLDTNGLGKPLPAGEISITEPRANATPVFIGENSVDDSPVGAEVNIDTGGTFDVHVDRRIVSSETRGTGDAQRVRDKIEIAIENDKPISIPFELWQDLRWDGARILTEDRPHVTDKGSALWRFPLAPGERVVVHYTVEYPKN